MLHPREKDLLLSQIGQLERLLRDTPVASGDHPKVLRQLADAYAELEAGAVNEKLDAELKARAVLGSQPSSVQALREAATKAALVSKEARKAAARHYQALADQHPEFCLDPQSHQGCGDEALYYAAYELEQGGDHLGARPLYVRIVSDWQRSRFVPYAYMAFGETLYAEAQTEPQKWAAAEQAYREVMKRPAPENRLWGRAAYKLGYVHWNTQALDKAIDDFSAAIAAALQYPSLPDASGLAEMGRRDLVAVYASAGAVAKAYDVFKPVAGDSGGSQAKTFALLERLGTALLDIGRYDDAIALYRDLLRRNPGDASCRYQAAVTHATVASKSGDKAAITSELEQQLRTYQRFDAERRPEPLRAACANETVLLLLDGATAWHLEAVGSGGVRGTGDERTLAAAAKLYQAVADNFGREAFARFTFPRIVKEDWPTLAKVRYWQADLAFFRKDWKGCGPAFDAAFAEDPNGRDAAAAAFGAADCYQRALDAERGRGAGPPPETGDRTARAFTAGEANMVGAFQRFLCRFKPAAGDREAEERYAEVKFGLAHSYFDAHHWDEAAEVYASVAHEHPDSDAAPFAANFFLESLHVLANTRPTAHEACMNAMAREAKPLFVRYCRGDKPKGDEHSCEVLHTTYVDLERYRAEQLVKACDAGGTGALAKCEQGGDVYMDLWKNELRTPCENRERFCVRADEVLYDAARAYQAAHFVARAIQVRTTLLDPRYHLADGLPAHRAAYEIGAAYQAIAVYDEAAKWYETFAALEPRGEHASDALADAVVLRLGLGQPDLAIADAAAFERAYAATQAARAAQVGLAVATYFAERGALPDARRRLAAVLPGIDAHATEDLRIRAHALMGRIEAEGGRRTAADAEYAKVRAAWADPVAAVARLDGIAGSDEDKTRRLARVLTAVGEAQSFAADDKRRIVEGLVFPSYRGSGSAADVQAFINTKVKEWMAKKEVAIENADRAYLLVKDLRPVAPPKWVVVAAASAGGMWSRFLAEIMRAPYPKDWDRPGYVPNVDPPLLWAELKASYQNELSRLSDPIRAHAKLAYQKCLGTSADEQFFDEHTRECERWLSQEYPNEYHLIDELRPTPSRANSGLDERSSMLDAAGAPLDVAHPSLGSNP